MPDAPSQQPEKPAAAVSQPAQEKRPPPAPQPAPETPAPPVSLPTPPPQPVVEKSAPPTKQPPVPTAPAAPLPAPPTLAAPPPAKPAESRSRTIYFARTGSGEELFRFPAARTIAVSDSPLLDSLNTLLSGPSAEEQRRGVISFIPPNSRIRSIAIRGNTAYIDFNEAFQFNTGGREGYALQIGQVVWTATEFPTVQDVQILIEGKRVDVLGEGIVIGSPLGRDMKLQW